MGDANSSTAGRLTESILSQSDRVCLLLVPLSRGLRGSLRAYRFPKREVDSQV